MNTVPLETISEIGISEIKEMSDKPEKKSGKKKKKSKKQEEELKNSDSHTTSQNGKADEAASSEEEKEGESMSSVLINTCLNSKGDLVEREGTDVELNETVSETQSPKAKKKKKKKRKTMEASDPLGIDCIENNDEITGRESMSNLLEDGNGESSREALGSGSEGVSDIGGERQKKKRKKKKSCESVTNMGCDSVQCLLSHLNIEGVENCDEAAVGTSAQNVEKTKKKKKDKKGEVDQDALGAEDVSKVEVKAKKKKKKKNSSDNTDGEIPGKDSAMEEKSVQNADDVSKDEVKAKKKKNKKNSSDSTDGEIPGKDSAMEEKSVQNAENADEKVKDKKGEVDEDTLGAEDGTKVEVKIKKKKNKKKNSSDITDGEIANNDLAIKIEDSATEEKEIDKKGEVDQDTLGAESASDVEVKTKNKKKKKSKDSSDHKTDEIEDKDDVSSPGNGEEPETDRENIEPSSSVLIDDHMAQGGSSAETKDVPRCSCECQNTKKLVVFDLNGILADIVKGPVGQSVPDGRVSYRSVFRRPFVSSFLEFCFERFEIGIWSSRHIGLDYMINNVMRHHARKLLFCFGQDICITTNFKTQENYSKPLFLKDIRRVWERFGTCFTCGKRKYDETNTLLVDDSPDKALCNPPHTGIFPFPYKYTDHDDSALGPEGELTKYLERLADAPNVQKFVEENPFGQTAITETHKSWEFYSKVIEAQSKASTS